VNARALAAIAALALPVAAAACDGLVGLSGPSIENPDASGAPLTCDPDASGRYGGDLAQLLGDLSTAMCRRMIRCAMIDSTDLDGCVTAVTRGTARYRTLQAAADAGAVTVDPCFASECLNDLQMAGCDPTSSALLAGEPDPAASASLTAQTGQSGSDNPYQWLSNLTLQSSTGGPQALLSLMSAFGGGACGRAFVGQLTSGSPSDDPVECAPGTQFVPASPLSPDASATCAVPVAIGDPCDFRTACPTSCATYYGGDAGPFIIPAGYCDPSAGSSCFCGDVLGEGEPCGVAVGQSAAPSPCAYGLLCDPVDNLCHKIGSRDAGATCTPGFDPSCAPSLYCDPGAMQCATRLPAGTPCSAEFACQDGLWCVGLTDGVTGVCAAPVLNGACDASKLKSNPLPGTDGCLALSQHCVSGTCTSLPSSGTCLSGQCSLLPPAQCVQFANAGAPGSNAGAAPEPGTCVLAGGPGTTCTTSADCFSGDCESGICTATAGGTGSSSGGSSSGSSSGGAGPPAMLSGTTVPASAAVAVESTVMGPSVYPDAGAFLATVALGVPFQLVATASGYLPMTLEEMGVTFPTASLPQPITLFSVDYANSLKMAAPGYDPSLGILGISVLSLGSCADPTGATLTVTSSDAGASQVIYLTNGMPSSAASVTDSVLPSAVAYNVPTGVDLSIAVSHPTCTQAPYPVAVPSTNVTLTGRVQASPGNTTSYALVYLQ
jgi:hypothetical protein